jgi:hypothetical protein
VAVEHGPKYQHKRFIELGRQGMGNPPSNPASGSADLSRASATVSFSLLHLTDVDTGAAARPLSALQARDGPV